MTARLLLIFLFSLISFTFSYPLNNDSTETDNEEWKWNDDEWDWDDEFDWEFNFWDDSPKSPTITINYGLSDVSINGFSGKFAKAALPEIKLGYTEFKASKYSENILRYFYNYSYLTNFSTDFYDNAGSENTNELDASIWRFGFGWANGYGYKLGEAAVTPYNSFTLGWSKLNMKDTPDDPLDQAKIAMFNETFRFGTSAEGGIRINIIPEIVLEAGYERSAVFQRHLFWKWAGSALIEAGGQWALDSFIKRIMETSPYAGPVVAFVLKNALSYGVYELREEKMNWPFDSDTPLSLDQFKFGITFNF